MVSPELVGGFLQYYSNYQSNQEWHSTDDWGHRDGRFCHLTKETTLIDSKDFKGVYWPYVLGKDPLSMGTLVTKPDRSDWTSQFTRTSICDTRSIPDRDYFVAERITNECLAKFSSFQYRSSVILTTVIRQALWMYKLGPLPA